MRRVRYVETTCRAAINRVHGMPFPWSLNPYRGCRHGCAYCYARPTHTFLGYDAGADFESVIVAKMNIAAVLAGELQRPSWSGETVAMGTATDPYQPAEGRFRLARACLETFLRYRTPVTITTKGTLIRRDVDLLQSLTAGPGVGVNISLITLDEGIWRALEPGTPPPRQRLHAMRSLAEAGVPCGLALAPVLPLLTDSLPALEALIAAAADNGAAWLWTGTLHLEPAVRDWLFPALERHFPAAAPRYVHVFGRAGVLSPARYTPRTYADALGRRVGEIKGRYGFGHADLPASTSPRQRDQAGPAQLRLPLFD